MTKQAIIRRTKIIIILYNVMYIHNVQLRELSTRAIGVSVSGIHGAQSVVDFSVVSFISFNCQEHIPHHCISLYSNIPHIITSHTCNTFL